MLNEERDEIFTVFKFLLPTRDNRETTHSEIKYMKQTNVCFLFQLTHRIIIVINAWKFVSNLTKRFKAHGFCNGRMNCVPV